MKPFARIVVIGLCGMGVGFFSAEALSSRPVLGLPSPISWAVALACLLVAILVEYLFYTEG